VKEIPLSGGAENAHQSFYAQLGAHEITFKLDFMSYVDDPYWNCDLAENGETLVAGLKLVGGCDLLEPYQLGLGKLIMTGAVPTLDNLGAENHLIWVEP
jgi:hypothetical protein